jgi:hypothetical protein
MAFIRKTDSGGGDTVKFNAVGDSVTGIYLGAQDYPDGKFGPTVKHIFNTKKGIKVVFAKSNNQITQLLGGEENKLVCLTFSGTKNTGKGNPMKLYTLDVDPDYSPTADELSAASNDDVSVDEEETEEEMTTAPAKSAPRAAAPSAAKRSAVNAFVAKARN